MKDQAFGQRRKQRMRKGRVFSFIWYTAQDHQWIDAKSDVESGPIPERERKYLVATNLMRRGSDLTTSRPLESASGLFRIFSERELTPDAIKAFADRYGMLGVGRLVKAAGRSGIISHAESRVVWISEIEAMRRAVRLWDATKSAIDPRKTHELGKLIKWRDKGVLFQSSGKSYEWIANPTYYPELLSRFQYPDLIQPARCLLQRWVNQKLGQFASRPQLLTESGELRLFIQPQNLVGAMWLQFARAIEGDQQYKKCLGCGDWFEVGGSGKRSDAETCSATCRQRWNRKGAGK